MADTELLTSSLIDTTNPWNLIAEQYANYVGEIGDEVRRHSLDATLGEIVGNIYNEVVLDAGCGHGYWSRIFAKLAKIVFATDSSTELLQIAASRKENPQNIRFHLTDLSETLPYPNEAFGLSFSRTRITMSMAIVQKSTSKEFIEKRFPRPIRPGAVNTQRAERACANFDPPN